jgi:hypothetical protein
MMSLNTHLIKILPLLLFFVVEERTLVCQIESSKELTGFRNFPWGSSIYEVKSLETENYLQTFIGFGVYALSYKSRIAGLTTRIDYTFKRGRLIEGSYSFHSAGYFKQDFNKLKDFLIAEYSEPDLKAGPLIESDSVWIKVTEYGRYKGPELYWLFSNGFIALVASKFEDEITLTILYTNDKSIEEYNKDREVSVESLL